MKEIKRKDRQERIEYGKGEYRRSMAYNKERKENISLTKRNGIDYGIRFQLEKATV